ncbi:hypothetical protein NP233_g4987 [Leucocoprinus birnbaumii]|uniref:Uncharacterized protein n=1 Tax=Leucocoprinus birnbaumii TaxID=56174 RepID=A0AAD5VVZ8_9AGAR|nr:hypothetical protein NP233_g4987 [Leucocoprinus birnbaumii]
MMQNYRLVYHETGFALHEAEDPSVAFSAMKDVNTAIILFLAGLVHRDISTGNIIVVMRHGKFHRLLSDFEQAKEVDHVDVSDPKTGTPLQLMSLEIHRGSSLPVADRSAQERIKELAASLRVESYKNHHDAEFLVIWTTLWFLLFRVEPWEDMSDSEPPGVSSLRNCSSRERTSVFENPGSADLEAAFKLHISSVFKPFRNLHSDLLGFIQQADHSKSSSQDILDVVWIRFHYFLESVLEIPDIKSKSLLSDKTLVANDYVVPVLWWIQPLNHGPTNPLSSFGVLTSLVCTTASGAQGSPSAYCHSQSLCPCAVLSPRCAWDIGPVGSYHVTVVHARAQTILMIASTIHRDVGSRRGRLQPTFITMHDGFETVARTPYPVMVPKSYANSTEVATMRFLRSSGLPIPEVDDYSPSSDNAAKREYILMELMRSKKLSDVSLELDEPDMISVLHQLVQLESRVMSICFPTGGSIYYINDLQKVAGRTGILSDDERFCVGLDASHSVIPSSLPANVHEVDQYEQNDTMELYHRRLAHFHYVKNTKEYNKLRHDALLDPVSMFIRRLFDRAEAEIWGRLITKVSDVPCPVVFERHDLLETKELSAKLQVADENFEVYRVTIGFETETCVPNEPYEMAMALAELLKLGVLTGIPEKEASAKVEASWFLDDMDEKDYMQWIN